MSLSRDDVVHLASMARIDLSEAELDRMLGELTVILDSVAVVQQAPTDGVEPMSHAQDLMLRLRDDAVTETDQHTAFQAIAPQVEGDLYLVPKVIE